MTDGLAELAAQLAASDQAAETPQMVPPMPVPMVVNVERVRANDGTLLVQLSISHPSGFSVFFFDQKLARQIAGGMRDAGIGGLVIPEAA